MKNEKWITKQDEAMLLQMKADLEVARKIVGSNKNANIESIVLSGIFMGRELENQRIKKELELSGVKIPNNVLSTILYNIKN
jgi:hypothetical protein